MARLVIEFIYNHAVAELWQMASTERIWNCLKNIGEQRSPDNSVLVVARGSLSRVSTNEASIIGDDESVAVFYSNG